MSAGVLIIKRRSDEDRHSPEFQELLRSTAREAKAVFGRARLLTSSPELDGEELDGDERYVLLLDRANTLLRRASLRAAKQSVDSAGGGAVALEIGSCSLEGDDELHTMGAFERIEARLLERGAPEQARPCDSVLLLVRSEVTNVELEAWISGNEPLARFAERLGVECKTAGVAHTFIDYYGEVRRDVLAYVPDGARTVLEVGCGRGVTGELLRRELGAHVTGFELNPEVAEDARERLDEVLVGDVLSVDPPSRYDVVLALELFEHLTDGQKFLERATTWLEPGGRIVLSVPNVGHWSVVEELLAGRWDYLPIGLLCTTHYRFFTRRTLEDWIEAARLDNYEIAPQKTSVPERFDSLAGVMSVDRDSLATKGFWVSIGL